MAVRTRSAATLTPPVLSTQGTYRPGVPGGGSLHIVKVSNRHDFVVSAPGPVGPSERILTYNAPVSFVIPAALAGSIARLGVAPTGSAAFTLRGNADVLIATITFAPGATLGTFTMAADWTFNVGDVFTIMAPAVQDVTLADVSMTIVARRLG